MQEKLNSYLSSIANKFSRLQTSEYGYRSELEILLKEVFGTIRKLGIDHDPKTQNHNKPDFVVLNGDVPILYLEAKDIGTNLDIVAKSDQMARYFGYDNLVLTDYLEFRFFRSGLAYGESIKIAEFDKKTRTITPLPNNFELLFRTLQDFPKSHKEKIKSGVHLAKIMGGKAQRLRDNVEHLLTNNQNQELLNVYQSIKEMLVADLNLKGFADMYAQTLVYGLFVARYYDETQNTFSRSEARELLPASNPFLRHFFDHIAGASFPKSLGYIIDELCVIFQHSDVRELMENHLDKKIEDPVIHFYEDFLQEYDPILKKKMGAYYTPLPVVDYIVHSVDSILRKEFKLANGLADTSKLPNGEHRVQILDPATGTGTFISRVIGLIYENIKKNGQQGTWPSYVHHNLLPRIFGFELMMTPYTIAHLRLSLAFKETGFKYFNQRLGIYLTNSLENEQAEKGFFPEFGLAGSIAQESKEANKIKNEKPIMVVLGNPPYSGVSSNETNYANSLVNKYKLEPGGQEKLQERKHWLNDDYVKFIAFAQDMVDKSNSGIVAFITNNGFIDNTTFRGMRWSLRKSFDKIYILDLHGNAKKKETTPEGNKDENVFDIMQGVSIILAIKKSQSKEQAKIYHSEIFGLRKEKFFILRSSKIKWVEIIPDEKNIYFVPKDNSGLEEYEKGFKVNELFVKNKTGIVTMGDNFAIADSQEVISKRIKKLVRNEYTKQELNTKFNLGKNYANYILANADKIIFDESKIIHISYRPFDEKYTYFDNKLIWRWREDVMRNFINKPNLGLLIKRQGKQKFSYVFITNKIAEGCMFESAYANNTVCPLYLYNNEERKSNLDQKIVFRIEEVIGKTTPEQIFDYIYASLHSPSYRKKYAEFLKIDFPRIPYPKNKEEFKRLIKLGEQLRELHLMTSPKVDKLITSYPIMGENKVEKVEYKNSKVWINSEQYFDKVPELAWNFYIGGYQPAQKWLKDRKGRELNDEDIRHWQKIIVVLIETDKLMKEVDTQ